MIYLITGKVGSGKTLLALTFMLEKLEVGGCVVTNVRLNLPKVDEHLKRKGRRLVDGQYRFHDFEETPDFSPHVPFGTFEQNVAVFIDEAQLYYNSANDVELKKILMDLIKFLTQSRKACIDVYFITQAEETVWRQFRLQTLYGYRCRDMRTVNFPVIGRLPMMGLKWSKYDVMSGETMERRSTPLSQRLFDLYDTTEMYDKRMRALREAAEVWKPVTKKQSRNAPVYDNPRSSNRRRRSLMESLRLLFSRGGEGAPEVEPDLQGDPCGSRFEGDAEDGEAVEVRS